jgi:hypothetical protein
MMTVRAIDTCMVKDKSQISTQINNILKALVVKVLLLYSKLVKCKQTIIE